MKFGLLTVANEGFLGHQLAALSRHGLEVDFILLDAKIHSAESLAIVAERIDGRLPALPLDACHVPAQKTGRVESHDSAEAVRIVRERQLDVLVNAGTPRILREPMLNAAPFGVLNCHPGLLPEFRGCTCVEWAIYLDRPVGNTVHRMSAGIDEGPILAQEPVALAPTDDYVGVRVKTYLAGFDLMARAVKSLADGKLGTGDFHEQRGGTYYKPIPPEMFAAVKEKLAAGRYAHQRHSI